MTDRQPRTERSDERASQSDAAGRSGTSLVLGLLSLAAGLGLFAVWFQWGQTRRCLELFGPEAARRVQAAERVELWTLAAAGDRVQVRDRQDVSQAAGLVHLRRGLIEDVNYAWGSPGGPAGGPRPARLPPQSWDVALAFFSSPAPAGEVEFDAGQANAATVIAFDLDGGGMATVVGRPGRVALGRIAKGLRTWVEDTQERGFREAKPGFEE